MRHRNQKHKNKRVSTQIISVNRNKGGVLTPGNQNQSTLGELTSREKSKFPPKIKSTQPKIANCSRSNPFLGLQKLRNSRWWSILARNPSSTGPRRVIARPKMKGPTHLHLAIATIAPIATIAQLKWTPTIPAFSCLRLPCGRLVAARARRRATMEEAMVTVFF